MSTHALQQRLARLEIQEGLAFSAFLLRLSPADARTWQTGVLETLAARGVISPPPADLWERPQPEKEAFIHMLAERIGGGHGEVRAAIRQAMCAWEQEHPA